MEAEVEDGVRHQKHNAVVRIARNCIAYCRRRFLRRSSVLGLFRNATGLRITILGLPCHLFVYPLRPSLSHVPLSRFRANGHVQLHWRNAQGVCAGRKDPHQAGLVEQPRGCARVRADAADAGTGLARHLLASHGHPLPELQPPTPGQGWLIFVQSLLHTTG